MSWTQAVCAICWKQRHSDRPAVRAIASPEEHCCFCNALTSDGIYVRVDPRSVPFPKADE